MGNLKPESPLVAKIYAAWKQQGDAEPERTYLGASILGHECDLYLWLAFRQALPRAFDGRMYRLFDRGRREEAVFAEDLRKAGCEVWELDPKTGRQFEVTFAGGHGGGHLDGVALGVPEAPKTPHVTEYKTHSDSSFRKLVKCGVAVAKPMHEKQMQLYMGEMGIDRALYLAVNKDTDELYAERVEFDANEYKALLAKAERIIAATEARPMTERPDDFRCATCPAKELCHKTYTTLASGPVICRTCAHWTAEKDGTCSCAVHSSAVEKGAGCANHVFLPFFVNATPKTGTRTSVTYEKDCQTFTNGPGAYTSDELTKLTTEDLNAVSLVKEACPGAQVVAVKSSLKDQFAEAYRLQGNLDFEGTKEEFSKRWSGAYEWRVIDKREIDGSLYVRFNNDALGYVTDGILRLVNAVPF